jgi:hypothetical protein
MEPEYDHEKALAAWTKWLSVDQSNVQKADALCARVIEIIDGDPRWPEPGRFAELLAFEAFGDGENFDMSDDDIREELDLHAVPPSWTRTVS